MGRDRGMCEAGGRCEAVGRSEAGSNGVKQEGDLMQENRERGRRQKTLGTQIIYGL